MAGFIQIIDFSTSKIDEIDALIEELGDELGDGLLAVRSTETEDRDRPGHYMVIVEFESYERAMENSNNPVVSKFSQRFAEFADRPPTFYNLDVRAVRER